MQRFLIGGIAAVVILLATAGIFAGVKSQVEDSASAVVEDRVSSAAKQYLNMSRLDGADMASAVAEFAGREQVAAVTSVPAEGNAQVEAAFTQVEAINKTLEGEGHKADVVALLDANGKVISRDLNPNAMRGDDLKAKYPAVGLALGGKVVKDVWNFADRPTRVALAPVRGASQTVVGALLVGYVLNHKAVRAMHEGMGAHVALFHNGQVQTSSFVRDDGQEDGNKAKGLQGALFGGDGLAQQALSSGTVAGPKRVDVDGETYVVAAAPALGSATDKSTGAALFLSLADAIALAGGVGSKVWLLGLLSILAMVVAVVLTARRFIRPIDDIELTVSDIINGNVDVQFQPAGYDLDGLSNGLNVMLARLLGRPEPSDEEVEEEAEKAWKAEQMVIQEGEGNPPGANAAGLAREHDVQYYPRLYSEYVNALRASGVNTDKIPLQLFAARLRMVEGGLQSKWSCRMVRCQLVNQGGNLVFQPVRID